MQTHPSLLKALQESLSGLWDAEDVDKNAVLYLGAFVGLILTGAVIFVAANDPKLVANQFFLYTVFAVVPAVVALVLVSRIVAWSAVPSAPAATNGMGVSALFASGYQTVYTIALMVLLLTVYFFFRVVNPKRVEFATSAMFLVGILGGLVGLAVVYRLFHRIVVNMQGWTGFFARLLFLLPCFVIDLLETLWSDLKSAPKMVVVLLLLEALVVFVYWQLPKWMSASASPGSNAVVLLDEPVFLSSKSTLLTKEDLPKLFSTMTPGVFNANYSVSMWVFVNDHDAAHAAYAKETEIFKYGHPTAPLGNPRVAYQQDGSQRGAWKFYLSSAKSDGTPDVELQLPTQRWNFLVITYQGNVVDVFANGQLERTVTLADVPKYANTDVVTVGEGDNSVWAGGLHGAICNVVFHKTPLSQLAVAADYNWNQQRNPPTHTRR